MIHEIIHLALNKFKKNQGLLLGLILLNGLILRVAGLNDPITYDEAYTAVEFSSRSWWAALSDYSLPNNHIFHTLLARTSTLLLGQHLWSLRLPALLGGLALILFSFLAGKAIYSARTGLAAAALVAWMPELVNISTSARGYSLVAAFTMLNIWLAWKIIQQPERPKWLLLAIFSALGLWTVPVMLYPAVGTYLWLLLEGPKNRKFLSAWLASGLFTGLLGVPLYAPALIVSGWQRVLANGFVQPVDAAKYFDWVLAARLKDTWNLWTADVPGSLVILLCAGLILALLFHRRIQSGRWPVALALAGWTVLLILARRPEAFDRFWSWLLAPLLLLCTAGLVETCGLIKFKRLPLAGSLAGVAILALVVASLLAMPGIPGRWAKVGNPQASAQYLVSALRPGDEVLAGYPNNAPVWYYLKTAGIPENVWQADMNSSRYYLVLSTNQKDETLESILRSDKLDPARFDLPNAEKVAEYGKIQIFRCAIR